LEKSSVRTVTSPEKHANAIVDRSSPDRRGKGGFDSMLKAKAGSGRARDRGRALKPLRPIGTRSTGAEPDGKQTKARTGSSSSSVPPGDLELRLLLLRYTDDERVMREILGVGVGVVGCRAGC
jgi:hypothetical protein